MKIVSVTVARNEADVIETFVRHHLQSVDKMIIVDHLSIDETPAILADLQAEGASIDVIRDARQEFAQAEMTTLQMRRAAQELGADWIFILDADEFLVSDEGAGVRSILEHLSLEDPYRIPWRSYIPRPDDTSDAKILFDRIQYRREDEPLAFYKVFVPGTIAARKTTVIRVGNHGIGDISRRRKKNIRGKVAAHLHLAHFPVRSVAQIRAKVLLGWPARLASPEQKGNMNFHLRELFEKLQKGAAITGEDLMTMALDYALPEDLKDTPQELVRDPVISPQGDLKLKYTTSCDMNLVQPLADLAADLAVKLATERERCTWKRIFSRRRTE